MTADPVPMAHKRRLCVMPFSISFLRRWILWAAISAFTCVIAYLRLSFSVSAAAARRCASRSNMAVIKFLWFFQRMVLARHFGLLARDVLFLD